VKKFPLFFGGGTFSPAILKLRRSDLRVSFQFRLLGERLSLTLPLCEIPAEPPFPPKPLRLLLILFVKTFSIGRRRSLPLNYPFPPPFPNPLFLSPSSDFDAPRSLASLQESVTSLATPLKHGVPPALPFSCHSNATPTFVRVDLFLKEGIAFLLRIPLSLWDFRFFMTFPR